MKLVTVDPNESRWEYLIFRERRSSVVSISRVRSMSEYTEIELFALKQTKQYSPESNGAKQLCTELTS